jgi:hypothetical protein
MSNWINQGEAKRLEKGSQWEQTVSDLCDLMGNYPKVDIGDGGQQEYATRAISFVLNNLKSRGIIDDQFIDIREDPTPVLGGESNGH